MYFDHITRPVLRIVYKVMLQINVCSGLVVFKGVIATDSWKGTEDVRAGKFKRHERVLGGWI
jgi:hypothetical protein